MKRLIVTINAEKVGHLDQGDSDRMVFCYDQGWLAKPDAYPLSKTLPLRTEPFDGKAARPFFAGVLPEQEPREKIAAILGISANNDFAMLERIGGDCAGAVSLLLEDFPTAPVGEPSLRRLTDQEFIDIVEELPRRPLMAGEANLRLSLAGAQNKLPVVRDKDWIALPMGDLPSSHIIKPEPKGFPGLTTNETFCMKLARFVGLNVPNVELYQAGKTPCIIVERYDRKTTPEGKLLRVHQEDFCQALGFPPERKYQQEGGPLVRDCIALLRDWSSVPVVDIREFIDGLAFNFLIGNADAHGKNFSMLYPPGSRRLAPFYDLVCTLAWPELSIRQAMTIGNCNSINDLMPDHFRLMAKENNLGWPPVRERLVKLCETIHTALADHNFQSQIASNSMTEKVTELVSNRTSVMLKRLALNVNLRIHKGKTVFIATPVTTNPSTFLQPGETFSPLNRFGQPNAKIELPAVSRLFLRLIPSTSIAIKTSKAALDLVQTGGLQPMAASGWFPGRNKYGGFVCCEKDGKITGVSQLFLTGELWGIDAWSIDIDTLKAFAKTNMRFFPSVALEREFASTLTNYLKFANETLHLTPPVRLIAGATDVLGYCMATNTSRFGGNVVDEHIVYEWQVDDLKTDPLVVLRPFFNYFWEQCGLDRPDVKILG